MCSFCPRFAVMVGGTLAETLARFLHSGDGDFQLPRSMLACVLSTNTVHSEVETDGAKVRRS